MRLTTAFLECYGGGPVDGRTVPVSGACLVVLEGDTMYRYLRTREDDGTEYMMLERTVALAA